MPSYSQVIDTPIGLLTIVANDDALTAVQTSSCSARPNVLTARAAEQLSAYFAGQLCHFELPLAPAGSAFQQRCWAQLQQIPYATTRSYGWQAEQLGLPGAARAVGTANGRNPLPIIIPCHRVVPAGGGVGGYNLGTANKRLLLALEAANNC